MPFSTLRSLPSAAMLRSEDVYRVPNCVFASEQACLLRIVNTRVGRLKHASWKTYARLTEHREAYVSLTKLIGFCLSQRQRWIARTSSYLHAGRGRVNWLRQ